MIAGEGMRQRRELGSHLRLSLQLADSNGFQSENGVTKMGSHLRSAVSVSALPEVTAPEALPSDCRTLGRLVVPVTSARPPPSCRHDFLYLSKSHCPPF